MDPIDITCSTSTARTLASLPAFSAATSRRGCNKIRFHLPNFKATTKESSPLTGIFQRPPSRISPLCVTGQGDFRGCVRHKRHHAKCRPS